MHEHIQLAAVLACASVGLACSASGDGGGPTRPVGPSAGGAGGSSAAGGTGGGLISTDSGGGPQPGCVPGLYEGTFDGEILIIGLVPLPINGNVSLTLQQSTTGSSSGEFPELEIANGNVTGADMDGNPYSATVEGKLNCTTYQIEGGYLRNGMYTSGLTYFFEGPAEAKYNPDVHAFYDGTWNVTETAMLATAGGTWAAGFVR